MVLKDVYKFEMAGNSTWGKECGSCMLGQGQIQRLPCQIKTQRDIYGQNNFSKLESTQHRNLDPIDSIISHREIVFNIISGSQGL